MPLPPRHAHLETILDLIVEAIVRDAQSERAVPQRDPSRARIAERKSRAERERGARVTT